MRRLAADHGSLHTAGLPPNYLFPPSSDDLADLTSLDVLLAGPVGTPYAGGVWRLHLDIPPTYPAAPPTAHFRTRLWHPNIDEATGAVCVETLKRDWSSTLKLRDVLVTISCLLIQPNPASALNEAAGKLATEDWDTYCRRAKLMTEIHAAVPKDIVQEVKDAQMRGEEVSAPSPHIIIEKAAVKVTPTASKVQALEVEDEENARRRGQTEEPGSDPESDWIPGPDRGTARQNNNIFGIKGLDDTIQQQPTSKRIFVTKGPQTVHQDKENDDAFDPFITVTSKNPHHPSSADRRLPMPSPMTTDQAASNVLDTPELLKFSHQNPFSAIQPNNQTHPLLKEFSYSWQDSLAIHTLEHGSVGLLETRKRLASEEFEKQRTWEMKRFKQAGFSLAKYNRGDFGPKTGVGRL